MNDISFQELVDVGERSYTHNAIYKGIKVVAKIPYKQDLSIIAKEDLKAKLHITRLFLFHIFSPVLILICFFATLGD